MKISTFSYPLVRGGRCTTCDARIEHGATTYVTPSGHVVYCSERCLRARVIETGTPLIEPTRNS